MEGAAILVAVVVVTLIASLNDYQKQIQFKKLNAVKEDYEIQCIRNGKTVNISRFDVCVGDVVCVNAGDEIEADGIIIESSGKFCLFVCMYDTIGALRFILFCIRL